MQRLIEVREFDTITHNPHFRDKFAYLPENAFKDLERFIREFDGDEEVADILNFMKLGYRRSVGDTITVGNHVGLIQTKSGYQIQILPKIYFRSGEIDQTKKVFLRMLRTLNDVEGKAFQAAELDTDHMNLYEVFISMYIREVSALIKEGLKSGYVNRENHEKKYLIYSCSSTYDIDHVFYVFCRRLSIRRHHIDCSFCSRWKYRFACA